MCQNDTGGAAKEETKDGGKGATIGIAMPTKTSERRIADGNNVVKQLKAAGYKTDLQFGDDKVEQQVSQVENMITKATRSARRRRLRHLEQAQGRLLSGPVPVTASAC